MGAPFDRLLSLVERDGAAVLVTVTRVDGSAPREAGAAMAVAADGSFSGTIGGGALEWQALADAQALMARPAAATLAVVSRSLGPDLGQCCGGRVELTLERLSRDDRAWLAALAEAPAEVTVGTSTASGHFLRRAATAEEATGLGNDEARRLLPDGRVLERWGRPPTPLYLFGAGHVGRALVLTLAPLPFRVTLVDARPDAMPRYLPATVAHRSDGNPADVLRSAPDGAFILVMTHSHALDLAIVSTALSARRFPYVGVIGSETKRARFASQMRQAGLPQERIDAMVCPIGLPGIHGKEPAVIAASVAAQILAVRDELAAAWEKPSASFASPSQGGGDRL
jgi:xanthine dehydrogenase accessory factor